MYQVFPVLCVTVTRILRSVKHYLLYVVHIHWRVTMGFGTLIFYMTLFLAVAQYAELLSERNDNSESQIENPPQLSRLSVSLSEFV